MDATTTIETISPILETCGFTAKAQGRQIALFDKKNRLAGHINADGTIKGMFLGRQSLLGSALKRNLSEAIEKLESL